MKRGLVPDGLSSLPHSILGETEVQKGADIAEPSCYQMQVLETWWDRFGKPPPPIPDPRPKGGSGCRGRDQAKLKLIMENSSAGWNRHVAVREHRVA